MKGKFSYFKLLCFLIISIFLFGFSDEVRADERFGSRGKLAYRQGAGWQTYFQRIYRENTNEDAYCLEHSKMGPDQNSFMTLRQKDGLLSSEVEKKIISIILASQKLNMQDDNLRYYITQAAIWYAKDGIQSDGQDGITRGFYDWLVQNYPQEWNALMSSSYSVGNFSVTTGSSKLTLDGDYYYSETFDVSYSEPYSVKIDAGSSAGACILLEGKTECETEWRGANPADSFKIRVNKPSTSGEVNVKFSVYPLNSVYDYSLETFAGLESGSLNWQSVSVLNSREVPINKSFSLKANYEVTPAEIELQKIDAQTNRKVAGAVLSVVNADNNEIVGSFRSTGEGSSNPTLKLMAGNYKLVEEEAPKGYVKNDTAVLFSVVNDGGVLKVKNSSGDFITGTPITISISDVKHKIMFRKVDQDGNPMAGITFNIVDYIGSSSNVGNSMLCAITDENGLLTRPCPGDKNTGNVKSDGIYTLGVDFGSDDNTMYLVREYCDSDSCSNYAYPSSSGNYDSALFWGYIDFHVGKYDGSELDFSMFNPNMSVEKSVQDGIPMYTMTFVNKHRLTIKKTDITGGNEIGGAHLIITDPSLQGDNVIAEWTSVEGKSRVINGIEIDHKYRLTEETAPAGYYKALNTVKMVNSIDFSMDADGNVTTYDINTGDVLTDIVGTDYEILIKNFPTKTEFSKTSAVTGEEIGGAHLKVCTSDSYNAAVASGNFADCTPYSSEAQWVSEAGKSKTIEALPAGSYYLVETISPAGYYTKTSAVSFEVKDDGTVTKVEMENKPTKVVISKLNQVTGNRIAGAHMEILNASDRTIAKDYNGDEAKWVSKEDEDWVIYGLPVGDYILVETIVPEGFQEGMIIDDELVNEYKFSVADEEDELYLGVSVEVMNAPNTGVSTLNLFAIGVLMIFAGYETIKIYRRKALN